MPTGIYPRTEYHKKKISDRLKNRFMGMESSQWKGGKPECPDCGKEIAYQAKRCKACSSKGKNNSFYGKCHSDISKEKIIKAKKGKHLLSAKGIRKHSSGYIRRLVPKHPFADKSGYVYEHRLIVEKQIGRYLHRWEVAHHINGIKNNNKPQNLMAFRNQKTHIEFEAGKKIDSKNIIFDGSN